MQKFQKKCRKIWTVIVKLRKTYQITLCHIAEKKNSLNLLPIYFIVYLNHTIKNYCRVNNNL